MGKYKTVIFDMDGTLLDTLRDLQCALNYGLAACGYAEHTIDEVRSYIGAGMNKLIELALPSDIRQRANDSGDNEKRKGKCWKHFPAEPLKTATSGQFIRLF